MEVEEIKRVIQKICDETKKQSLEGLRACYTDDVVLIPPGEIVKKGQDAEDTLKQFIEEAREFQVENEVVKVNGNRAMLHGNYILYDRAGEVLQKGYLMSALRKDEGNEEWKVSHEMWK